MAPCTVMVPSVVIVMDESVSDLKPFCKKGLPPVENLFAIV